MKTISEPEEFRSKDLSNIPQNALPLFFFPFSDVLLTFLFEQSHFNKPERMQRALLKVIKTLPVFFFSIEIIATAFLSCYGGVRIIFLRGNKA